MACAARSIDSSKSFAATHSINRAYGSYDELLKDDDVDIVYVGNIHAFRRSIGEKCLLGANSGLGISLGNNCVIEAGTYITAASKVKLPDGEIVKAALLSGASNLLFRRNSLNGGLEVVMRTGTWGGLNSILHAN